MLLFGYPFVERKKFERNFLRSVVIDIAFDPIKLADFEDVIKSVFAIEFPRFINKNTKSLNIELRSNQKTPIVKVGDGVGGCQLISSDGQCNLSFSTTSAVLNISGSAYQDFSTIRPLLVKLVSLFPQLGIDTLRRVSMRKINILNFEASDVTSVFSELLQPDLSPEMFAAYPNPNLFAQNLINVSQVDGDYRMNIAYGIPPVVTVANPLKGTFVLDFDILCTLPSKPLGLVDELETINQTIYNAFWWMTSDKMKSEILGLTDHE